MNSRFVLAMTVTLAAGGCLHRNGVQRPAEAGAGPVPAPDAEACVRRYVQAQAERGDGVFRQSFDGHKVALRLIRVHAEVPLTLATGNRSVCADFEDADGDRVDLDFTLAGEAGRLAVLKTLVHKVNGQPRYVWERVRGGVWRRLPVGLASERQLGVVRPRDSFEFRYAARVPALAGNARLWLPLPETDAHQVVEVKSVAVPGTTRMIRDRNYGNRILYAELGPDDGGKAVELVFSVVRLEKAPYAASAPAPADRRGADARAPVNDLFRAAAGRAAKGGRTDMEKARALYEHVIGRMRLAHPDGAGFAGVPLQARAGGGVDYHAYFILLARSIGIPARLAVGAAIPAEREDGVIDDCHSWAEFYAEGKWNPVDLSEGDHYPTLASYYFGHQPANRFELSRGRDLQVDPAPASGPITLLADPVLEVDGRRVPVAAEFSFRRSDVWLLVKRIMRTVGD